MPNRTLTLFGAENVKSNPEPASQGPARAPFPSLDARLRARAPAGRVDRPAQAERSSSAALPAAARLGAAQVVVLDARADGSSASHRAVRLLEVVADLAGGELSDRQHRTVSTAQAVERSERAKGVRRTRRDRLHPLPLLPPQLPNTLLSLSRVIVSTSSGSPHTPERSLSTIGSRVTAIRTTLCRRRPNLHAFERELRAITNRMAASSHLYDGAHGRAQAESARSTHRTKSVLPSGLFPSGPRSPTIKTACHRISGSSHPTQPPFSSCHRWAILPADRSHAGLSPMHSPNLSAIDR